MPATPGAPPPPPSEDLDQAPRPAGIRGAGGLLYFIDCLGKPTEAYEHDMKLWWPHDEILIASMMIFRDTGDVKYLEKFGSCWTTARSISPTGNTGEWYGYLRRDGLPTMPSTKGSTFKGPFHLPRMLSMVTAC